MSSFIAKKLDIFEREHHTLNMGGLARSAGATRTAAVVRQRIERGGERLWRLEDFRDLSFEAVAQALSRLTREGVLERLSKGVYYRTRETAFGKSRPNPAAIQKLASKTKTVFPAGIAAANLLGFTTQTARRSELATSALSLPRKLVGKETVIHARRPEAWTSLSKEDAALLDFLRRAGRTSELPPHETIRRVLKLLTEKGRFERLLKVVDSEPPRVRAMLGAIGEQLGKNRASLKRLRESLNPFSKFDFGALSGLPRAHNWQVKERRPHETV
jgi:predicted transcriptional regulator of viral defense system